MLCNAQRTEFPASDDERVSYWRDIIDSLSEGIIVLSAALEPVAVNPAAESLIGVSQSNPALMKDLMRRNAWLEQMVTECLGNGQDLSQAETTLAMRRGTISVSASVSPLLTRTGHRMGAIVLLHDVSHQRGFPIREEDGESATLGLSAAGLAHEIKNPLTGIKGAAELLANLFPSDYRARQYCDVILRGVDRLASLVEQVLAVSGPQRLKREPVNIHQVLHHALAMAGLYPATPRSIVVEQRFDPSLPEVSGDAAALERVFLNLIKNAVEAIDADGVIRLHTRMETQFRLTSRGVRRQFLRVEISDSGKGMTSAEASQLFTPFYTTKPDGTGLGLVLSQRIIALHGGKIWAECSGWDNAPAANVDGIAVRNSQPNVDSSVSSNVAQRSADRQEILPGMIFKVTLPIISEPSNAAAGKPR